MRRSIDEAAFVAIEDLGTLPFHIGVFDSPHNPEGIPDALPFRFGIRRKDGLLIQIADNELGSYLARAYAKGHLLGTAMDDTELGRNYADDFYKFILQSVPNLRGLRVLEIGCGRGYLLRLMVEAGADALGIEPGLGLRDYWQRNGVDVVEDTFPSSQVKGTFDLIVAYGVLEHIDKPDDFVAAVRAQLAPGGQALFSVPNSEAFLNNGDPSMFIHEHFSYFSPSTLQRFLEANSLEVSNLREAGFGGALYCAWRPCSVIAPGKRELHDVGSSLTRHFAAWREFIGQEVRCILDEGRSLGIFCPIRALSVLPTEACYRFFDDDRELHGRYYPPFNAPVESRDQLIEQPVDELWIYSHTFGPRLAKTLREILAIRGTEVTTLEDLTQRVQTRRGSVNAYLI